MSTFDHPLCIVYVQEVMYIWRLYCWLVQLYQAKCCEVIEQFQC